MSDDQEFEKELQDSAKDLRPGSISSYFEGANWAKQNRDEFWKKKAQKLVDGVKAGAKLFDKMLDRFVDETKDPGILVRENPFEELLKEWETE